MECGLAPIPRFGLIIYNKKVSGNTTVYGTQVTYKCKPPLALFGDSKAECTSNGTWTETPKCRGRNMWRCGAALMKRDPVTRCEESWHHLQVFVQEIKFLNNLIPFLVNIEQYKQTHKWIFLNWIHQIWNNCCLKWPNFRLEVKISCWKLLWWKKSH